MRKKPPIRLSAVCRFAICNIFESKSMMTKMILWTMFGKVHAMQGMQRRPLLNSAAADVKLIRFDLMSAGDRMFSFDATKVNGNNVAFFLFHPSAQTFVYFQSIILRADLLNALGSWLTGNMKTVRV